VLTPIGIRGHTLHIRRLLAILSLQVENPYVAEEDRLKNSRVGFAYNTRRMAYAYLNGDLKEPVVGT